MREPSTRIATATLAAETFRALEPNVAVIINFSDAEQERYQAVHITPCPVRGHYPVTATSSDGNDANRDRDDDDDEDFDGSFGRRGPSGSSGFTFGTIPPPQASQSQSNDATRSHSARDGSRQSQLADVSH